MSSAAAAGNVSEALAGLLGQLGVQPTAARDQVTDTVTTAMAERGHQAEVVGLRYGTLTLRATPRAARLLGYDRDQLLAALAEAVPGAVTAIRISTR